MSDSPRVVVTRTTNQADSFSAKLRAAGFTPVEFPAIALEPLSAEPLAAALTEITTFNWLIFTSANAVDFFFQNHSPFSILHSPFPKVAASGSATARKLAELGVTADFIPDEFVGEQLVAGLGDLRGQRVLLPRAKIGRPKIVELLREGGADVVEVALYDTVTAVPTPTDWQNLAQGFAAITFTSPSSVRNFMKLIADKPQIQAWLATAVIICIGPITAQAAATSGLTVTHTPDAYTIDGMVAALESHFHDQSVKREIGD